MHLALKQALFQAAGDIQVDANQIGTTSITEADLRAAVRRAVATVVGESPVRPEVTLSLSDWTGRVGGSDLVVDKDNGIGAAIELKWALKDAEWATSHLLHRTHAKEWTWLLKQTVARPKRLPLRIRTRSVWEVQIHLASEEDWVLRGVEVRADSSQEVVLEDGQVLAEEPEPCRQARNRGRVEKPRRKTVLGRSSSWQAEPIGRCRRCASRLRRG